MNREGAWRRQRLDSAPFPAVCVPCIIQAAIIGPLVRLRDTLSPPRDNAIASARNESGRIRDGESDGEQVRRGKVIGVRSVRLATGAARPV